MEIDPSILLLIDKILFMISVLIIFGLPLLCILSIKRSYRNDIHSNSFSFILGHLPFILENKGKLADVFLEAQDEIYKKYGSLNSIYYLPLGQSLISTSDPANLQYILETNFSNYVKGEKFQYRLKMLLGHGIFNVDGEKWKKQSMHASSFFNVTNYKEFMMGVFIETSYALCKRLDKAVGHKAAIDLYDLLLLLSLDNIMKIGMGSKSNTLLKNQQPPFAKALDSAQTILCERHSRPPTLWHVTEWVGSFRPELYRQMRTIRTFASNVVKKRKNETDFSIKTDLLSEFLKPSLQNDKSTPFTDLELRDIVINLIIIGRDTIGQALSWCFFLLCQHPRVLTKLREEINAVWKKDQTDLDYDTVNSLSYAQAVFKETLRLYPSVPKEIKYAVKDDVWPDGTKIPAGQAIIWSPYGMGRSEHLWGSDALEFRPERWETEFQPSPFKYPVFNAGPRACPGQQMAMLEGVFYLALLVQKYDFHLVDPSEVIYNEALTLQMKNGLRVRVKKKSQ